MSATHRTLKKGTAGRPSGAPLARGRPAAAIAAASAALLARRKGPDRAALADRPGPEELIAGGEIDEPVPQAQAVELAGLVERLRRHRAAEGLSLTAVAGRSGLTRAAISRLENGWNRNPT